MKNQLKRHHEYGNQWHPDGIARELRFAAVVPHLYNGSARSST